MPGAVAGELRFLSSQLAQLALHSEQLSLQHEAELTVLRSEVLELRGAVGAAAEAALGAAEAAVSGAAALSRQAMAPSDARDAQGALRRAPSSVAKAALKSQLSLKVAEMLDSGDVQGDAAYLEKDSGPEAKDVPDEVSEESCGDAQSPLQELSESFKQASHRVHVHIHSASGLRDADLMIGQGSSDPYCVCKVHGRAGAGIKTSVVVNTLNPVWNFEGELEDVKYDDQIEFSLYDEDWLKDDDFLGSVIVEAKSFLVTGFEGQLILQGTGKEDHPSSIRVSILVDENDDEHFQRLVLASQAVWALPDSTKKGSPKKKTFTQRLHSQTSLSNISVTHETSLKFGGELMGAGYMQRMVAKPSASMRQAWDSVSLALVAYDVFMVPFAWSFQIEINIGLFIFQCFTALFWTVDMISTFFTGYYDKGLIEMRIHRIAAHYIKNWFVLDFLLAVLDWVFIILRILEAVSSSSSQTRMLRVLKSIRAIRSVRLLVMFRVSKVVELLGELFEHLRGQVAQNLFALGEAVAVVLSTNHIICCMWYALGRQESQEFTWIKAKNLEDRGIAYKYFTALHWALTQFTPASMDVQPTNTAERVFTLIVDLCGLVAFSTFVSSITTRMTQIRSFNKDQFNRQRELNRYFAENHVSLELGKRIFNFVNDRKAMPEGRVKASAIQALQKLPLKLRQELAVEVFMPCLANHPFMLQLRFLSEGVIRELCNTALTEHTITAGNALFHKGTAGTCLYFVRSGLARYDRGGESLFVSGDMWISEAVLWIEDWLHRGSLKVPKFCEFIAIASSDFRQTMNQVDAGQPRLFMRYYAALFVRDSCEHQTFSMRHSDVWCDRSRICELSDQAHQCSFDHCGGAQGGDGQV